MTLAASHGEERERHPEAAGPRIYNLFPLLVGSIEAWHGQLPHIELMEFDWLYLNPFHEPGLSGSLYAIKDPLRLHPLFDEAGKPDALLRGFTEDAARHGLQVMMDLVINHTAKDALLVSQHPEWYRRGKDGAILSPSVVAPDDASKVTVWGDLAELDYGNSAARKGLVDYWLRYLRHYLALGFRGFRCDAAYKVPADVWRQLIDAARAQQPEAKFFAETLGCTVRQVEELRGAGFDYLFNSSKWWDFRSDWLLDQYEKFRRIAPSIAFPESHDTPRLAAEIGSNDPDRITRHATFRYLFAACFSTGVMIPIGYEYGFRKPLDVVKTRPEDWEEPIIDISEFIAATNAMKRSIAVLNEEGPQRRITAPHSDVLGLLRQTTDRSDGCALVLLNPDPRQTHRIDPGPLLAETGGVYEGFEDVTPQASPLTLLPGQPITLDPLELRVFRGELPGSRGERPLPGGAAAKTRRAAREGTQRLVIEAVWPEIDGGRHPVKRIIGDVLEVWADIFCDGHDRIDACLRYKEPREQLWREMPMTHFDNDRWVGRIPLTRIGRSLYTIDAWRDAFASWQAEVAKKQQASQPIAPELLEGRALIEAAMKAASARDATALRWLLERLEARRDDPAEQAAMLLSDEVAALMKRAAPRADLSRYEKELEVAVDRQAAVFGAWYEMFPRSAAGDASKHGTFDDVIRRLPYVRDMGFDVLYFPPIHPIGRTNRKGRNNSLTATPADPGSPYAIGAPEGGHDAIHPQLGTLADFERLVAAARFEGIEIALDFAVQCSPDHPWIKQHPEWFDWRADGSIKFAENPPKKYEDIVSLRFQGDPPGLWEALRDIALYWANHGVRILRVDNPHTKPVAFWEWMIRDVQERYPDMIFLAEAFTRPKMMRALAKAGFTQSYTYFTWRNTKAELTEYLTELTQTQAKEYFRPNFFVNTPDINPPFLQTGGAPAFKIRALLAATLSSLWGMYSGFELCEATPLPGREEYLNSEKYEIKAWDWDRPGNIRDYIARLNHIRRDNPALHRFDNLRFHTAHHEDVLFYGKATAARDNVLWIAVNLDPHNAHEASILLPYDELGLGANDETEVTELLDGAQFRWRGREQRIRLDPERNPCAVWRVTPPPAARR